MATADVLDRMVGKLEATAVEIESEAREMFKATKLIHIPGSGNVPLTPKYSWEKPKDIVWLEKQRNVTRKYQKWYSAASHLIREYIPDRTDYFAKLYASDNPTFGYYHGFFNALWLKCTEDKNITEAAINEYLNEFEMQRSLLLSIPALAEFKELDLRRVVSADLVESELEYADFIYRKQKKEQCERAACVLAGVALERHLKTWCEICFVPLPTDRRPTLNTLIDALYNGGKGHIDLTQKNKLETMASIRNDCAHPGTVERSRVGELIQDVKRILAWPMH